MNKNIHRFCLLILQVGLLTACSPAATPTPTALPSPTPTPQATATPADPHAGWNLVWQDEFDGTTLNKKNWTYDTGGGGWGNNEMQLYTKRPENSRVENGILTIQAIKEVDSYGGSPYISARLKTQRLQAFQYGRIEARLKVPAGQGVWPAFWLLGEDVNQVGWPNCGEIDIMEYVGQHPTQFLGTMHGPGYSGGQGLTRSQTMPYNISDDFHTFAIEWDQDQISWFYDDVRYSTYTRADVGDRQWVFDHPFFIILNLAMGGTLGGRVDPDLQFPVQYLVDYVRVYQR